ncbi:MAG: holin family protein [Pseudomonadota bacterium]
MGLIGNAFNLLFGGGRNVIVDTAEVFRVNAEAGDKRASELQSAALEQMAREFQPQQNGWFDRLVDGLNRLPRPAMALGTIALFISAMSNPVWFSERMQGISLVPEPMWWLLGVVVSFYFGARHQAKGQEFQRSLAQTMARTPQVVRNIEHLRSLDPSQPQIAHSGTDSTLEIAATETEDNPALAAWKLRQDAPE